MTKDEALKLALGALLRSRKAVAGDYDLASCAYGRNDPDGHRYQDAKKTVESVKEAINACKQALAAQPEQEPPLINSVKAQPAQGPMHPEVKKMYEDYFDKCFRESSAAQRKPLTDEQITEVIDSMPQGFNGWMSYWDLYEYAQAIEAKLKEKNT
jgi:hypothetical protein